MDLSKEYIRMCERATEVEKTWSYLVGDFYYDKGSTYVSREGRHEGAVSIVETHTLSDMVEGNFMRSKTVWMPRQDQLQEMADLRDLRIGKTVKGFVLYNPDGSPSPGHYSSLEKLWLVLVMREKYQRKWDGDQWIRE